MKEMDIVKVADRMRALCSRREYSSVDILKKAAAALDGNKAEAEKIVTMLIAEKYIDDVRYASAYARDKSALSGWGAVKIRYMLFAKGLSADVISEALDNVDEDKAQTRLEKLMESKLRSLKEDPQCRLKLLRYGLGRGYGYDEVSSVMDKLMKQYK